MVGVRQEQGENKVSVQIDFSLAPNEDGTIQVNLQPPTPIGGWSLRFDMWKRFGSDTPIISKFAASGFNGVSGITIVDSGQGVLQVQLFNPEMSGQDFGAYAYRIARTSSGFVTNTTEGYRLCAP